ncbi:MAG: hypothetical protein ACREQ9_19955 [Candidatus Binatia bacterium]
MEPTYHSPSSFADLREAFQRLSAELDEDAIRIASHQNDLVVRIDLESLAREGIELELEDSGLSLATRGESQTISLLAFDVKTRSIGASLLELALRERQARARKYSTAGTTRRGPVPEEALDRLVRSAGTPVQRVFVIRAMNAIADLSGLVRERELTGAAASSDDVQVLVDALSSPEVAERLRKADPLAPAKIRGIGARKKLLEAEGGVLSAGEVADLLGISRQAVDKRRRAGKLIGVLRGRRGYAYPAWQFSDGSRLPNIERVLDALSRHDPWMQLAFFLSGNTRLDGDTPLAKLREGEVEEVVKAARAFGEQGAA